MNRATLKELVFVTLGCSLALHGCSDGTLFDFFERQLRVALPSYAIVGEDDAGRVLLAVEKESIELEPAERGDERPTSDLFALNLDTLEVEQIATDIPARAYRVRADGRYLAWEEWPTPLVVAREIDTGLEFDAVVGGDAFGGSWPSIVSLDDRRLVVHRAVGVTEVGFARGFEFVIIDLESRDEQVIGDSWPWGTIAFSGDHAALMQHKDTDVEILQLELSAHVDVVNLTTGERKPVARNIRVDANGGAIFTSNGRFIWQEFKSGGFQSKVRDYDPERDHLETPIGSLDRGVKDAWLIDVDDEYMLVERQFGEILLGQVSVFELLDFDGETTSVVEFANTLIRPRSFRPQPQIRGRYVVWTDPYDGDLLIHDPAIGDTRRIDPREFGENN